VLASLSMGEFFSSYMRKLTSKTTFVIILGEQCSQYRIRENQPAWMGVFDSIADAFAFTFIGGKNDGSSSYLWRGHAAAEIARE